MIDWPIAELLPHAGDMILLDGVERFDDDNVETVLQVRADGLLNTADGSLPAWVGVEIMAQSVAAFAGCHARQADQPVELGFLLGTRSYQCNVEAFPAGADLRVRANAEGVRVENADVTDADIQASNGVIHAINRVLTPPEQI